jgi:serine protease Do
MFAGRSLLGMSTTLGVIFAGSVGLAALGVPPSVADRLGGLLHADELAVSAVPETAKNGASVNGANLNGASLADVVAKVKPAVVSVTATYTEAKRRGVVAAPNAGRSPDYGAPRGSDMVAPRGLVTSQGAGFFISADGYAVTNHHVVESSRTVELATDDGTTYKATVIASDPANDLALLKVNGRNDFPFVRFAKKPPRVGERVFAVGNPFGLGGTVTAGIVSALDRNIGDDSYDGLIQIDAPINKGNSGGPCFDLDGDVVGVNTIIVSPSGGSVGIGFAVPAETVIRVASQLKAGRAVARGSLGVQMQPVSPIIAEALGLKEARGALIAHAKPDAPGAQAGLAAGDVIASINGEPVKDNFDVLGKVAALAPGTAIDLGIVRNGTVTTVAATLGETPLYPAASQNPAPSRAASDLGMTLAPADQTPGNKKNGVVAVGIGGVVVVGIDPVGRAAGLGINPGDVILDVSGRPVRTPNEVRDALHSAHVAGRPAALMRLQSGDKMRFVAVSFDPA